MKKIIGIMFLLSLLVGILVYTNRATTPTGELGGEGLKIYNAELGISPELEAIIADTLSGDLTFEAPTEEEVLAEIFESFDD